MTHQATASIIDGKAIAAAIRAGIKEEVTELTRTSGIRPGLAVVLVGEDPASKVYVRNKEKATTEAGMKSIAHRLDAHASELDLLLLIEKLNEDPAVHGILVQLPLPRHIDAAKVIEAIHPDKDVDGFHPINAGRLATGQRGHVPCTPKGCVALAKSAWPELSGLEAVVVGRSNIVGKPVAQLLLDEHCTVTICHSRTRDLPEVTRRADLLIAAVGRPELIRGDWIKPGAIVIDVGINRVDAPELGDATSSNSEAIGQGKESSSSEAAGQNRKSSNSEAVGQTKKSRLVGDVAFDEAVTRASHITPVPGGVGPMTIAMLLANTLDATKRLMGV